MWPRVESLLSDQEQALHDEARTSLSFAVNLSLAVVAVGVARAAGVFSNLQDWRLGLALNLLPLVVSYVIFRALAIDALVAGGRRIRSSLDVHRLELYEKLGVQSALTFSERERDLGGLLSNYLLSGPSERSDELGRREWSRADAGK